MKKIPLLVSVIAVAICAEAWGQNASIGVEPAPGTYDHNVLVALSPPSDANTGSLGYTIQIVPDGSSANQSVAATADEIPYDAPLYLTALPNQRRSYRIRATYSVNGASSVTSNVLFTIDLTAKRPATSGEGGQGTAGAAAAANAPGTAAPAVPAVVPILSPVAGTFANKQLLFIPMQGFSTIRYTLDGSDPSGSSSVYRGPVMIDKTGDVTVRVAAFPRGGAPALTTAVRFTVTGSGSPLVSSPSGLYNAPFQIPGQPSLEYAFGASPDSFLPFNVPLQIAAPAGGVAYAALTVEHAVPDDSPAGAPQRYFYSVDRRSAPLPVIRLIGGDVVTPRTEFAIEDAPFTRIVYSTDGSTPDSTSTQYDGPFHVQLTADSSGMITVKARALAPNGDASPVVTQTYAYLTKRPVAPTVGIDRTGGLATIHVSAPDGSVPVYTRTFDGGTPVDPSADSPIAVDGMKFSVPRGIAATAQLKFASVDRTGAVSPPTSVYSVALDNRPIAAPSIVFADGTLEIAGSGEIHYTLTDTGVQPAAPGPTSPRYQAPIQLAGIKGSLAQYRVRALSIGEDGNASSITEGGPFPVDLRSPALPPIWGVADGGVYDAPVTLFVRPNPGIDIHYTVSDNGSVPPDPTAASPVISGQIDFTAKTGETKHFSLKLLPAIDAKVGSITALSFVVDRSTPGIPLPSGFTDNTSYDRAVTLSPPALPPGETELIAIDTGGKPGDPLGESGQPLNAPVVLDAAAGSQLRYSFRLATRDQAGNTAVDPNVHTVVIDKIPPDPPVIRATTTGGTAAADVTVSIEGAAAHAFYEVSTDTAFPIAPSTSSTEYQSPFVLRGKPGSEILYTVSAISEDDAGNLSTSPSLYRVLIREPATVPPPAPAAAGTGSPGSPAPGAGTSGDTVAPSSAGSSAQSTNGASAASTTAAQPPTGPFIQGIAENGVTNRQVVLTSTADSGVVRYTVNASGGEAAAVTQFSTILTGSLVVDQAVGETRSYVFNFAWYPTTNTTQPGAQERLHFVVDRTPPRPPVATGITDGARYESPQTISLGAPEGTIFVSVDKLTPFGVSPESDGDAAFVPYTAPIELGNGENAIARYRIRAYTKDTAGNTSASVPEWTVYFDHGVVYLAPGGDDRADGTSSRPVGTIGRAVELAQESGRNTIIAASGSYALAAPVDVTEPMSIVGGFAPGSWAGAPDASAITSISPTPGFSRDAPLITVDRGGLAVEGITISDPRKVQDVIVVRGASLSLTHVSVNARAATDAVVQSRNAAFRADASTFTAAAATHPLWISGGSAILNGVAVAGGTTTGDVTMIALENNVQATFTDTRVLAGTAHKTTAISVSGSKLDVQKGSIDPGVAATTSTGILSSGSTLTVNGTAIASNAASRVTFGIQADTTTLTASALDVQARAAVGATGIYAASSNITIDRAKITASDTSEFTYLGRFAGGRTTVTNSLFVGSRTSDFVALGFAGGTATVGNVTVVGGTGRDRDDGVLLDAQAQVSLFDSIVAKPSPTASPGSIAISVTGGSALLTSRANDLAGYAFVYQSATNGFHDAAMFDASDGRAVGGKWDADIGEDPARTFAAGGYLLNAGSACIGAGVDPATFNGPTADIDGAARSAPYDIGAYRHR